jgi:uncharacterized protein
MIRSILLSGIAAIALSACGPGGMTIGGSKVPANEAEKAAMATEIATIMTDPAMMDQMFSSQMAAGAMPDMSAMCAAVPPDQAAACTQKMDASKTTATSVATEMTDKAKALMPALMQDMGTIMAAKYTGEELVAMKDFYSSPEGKSIMQKQPQVMAEFMPKMLERMQPLQMEMVQKLSERMIAAAAATTAVAPGATTVAPVTVTPAPVAPITPAAPVKPPT